MKSTPRPASIQAREQLDRFFAWTRRPTLALLRPRLKIEVHGLQHLPTEGPALVLSNHSCAIDPYMLVLGAHRSIQFLTTDTLCDHPYMGPVHRWWGAIPKRRFHKDVGALKGMMQWAAAGSLVGVFPEGERTWTGELGPLQGQLGRLLIQMKLPVVLARFDGAYALWPRWMARPRLGHVRLTWSAPRTFSRGDNPADIEAWVRQGLTEVRYEGQRITRPRLEGVENLLYRCANCGGDTTLVARRDRLRCTRCSAEWVADTHLDLHRDGKVHTLAELSAHIDDAQRAAWSTQTTPWLYAETTLFDRTVEARSVGHGTLTLSGDRLELRRGQQVRWSVPTAAIHSANIEYTHRLEFQAEGRTYSADLPATSSAYRWPLALAYASERCSSADAAQMKSSNPTWNQPIADRPSHAPVIGGSAGTKGNASAVPTTPSAARPAGTTMPRGSAPATRNATTTAVSSSATPPKPRTAAACSGASVNTPANRSEPSDAGTHSPSSATANQRDSTSPRHDRTASATPTATSTASVAAAPQSIEPPNATLSQGGQP